jgi:hypothetical protein
MTVLSPTKTIPALNQRFVTDEMKPTQLWYDWLFLIGDQSVIDLPDLEDVAVTSPSAGDVLIYNATSGVWNNSSLTAAGGIDITNADASVTISSIDWTNTTEDFLTTGTADIGNINIDTNTISATNSHGNIILTPNGNGNVDIYSAELESSGININGTTYSNALRINDFGGSNDGMLHLHRHSTTLPTSILGSRSNSDTTGHTAVTNGQQMMRVAATGWTGTHYDFVADILFKTSSSGTISGTSSPGALVFRTVPDGSNNPATVLTLDEDKSATFAGALTASTTIDFGSASSLEIPNSATPTVDADGEIAVDTTVTDFSAGVLKYYSGEEMGVVAMPIAQFTSPTDGYVVAYNATTDEFELVSAGSGGGAPTDAQYVTLSTDGTLSDERVLTAGEAIDFTDGGAGSTLTIDCEDASTTNKGVVELSTDAEVATGTSTSLVPTVDQLGWVLISTATASASSTIEFTNLSSTYHKYVVVITDVDVSNDNTQFNMRTSTDNGSTWDSGGTDYDWAYIYRRSNNTQANGGAEDDDHIEFFQFVGSGTNELWAANVEIFGHADSEYTFALCNFTKSDTANRYNIGFSGGRRVSAADVDAIQFYMSAGTFTTGTFKLYGVKA